VSVSRYVQSRLAEPGDDSRDGNADTNRANLTTALTCSSHVKGTVRGSRRRRSGIGNRATSRSGDEKPGRLVVGSRGFQVVANGKLMSSRRDDLLRLDKIKLIIREERCACYWCPVRSCCTISGGDGNVEEAQEKIRKKRG
jgi:hypothetical protein